MPFDIKNIDKPARFYWDEGQKEWCDLRSINRKEIVAMFKQSGIKQSAEYKINPENKQYQRIEYVSSDFDRDIEFGNLMVDAIIVDWNFMTPEGEPIPCTKDNKIILSNNPQFKKWLDDCMEILRVGKEKKNEDEIKN